MKLFCITTFVLFIYIFCVNTSPIFDDLFDFNINYIQTACNNFGCPNGTTICTKNTTTIANRTQIKTDTGCYDSSGKVLKKNSTKAANPIPGTLHTTYEFYGSFGF